MYRWIGIQRVFDRPVNVKHIVFCSWYDICIWQCVTQFVLLSPFQTWINFFLNYCEFIERLKWGENVKPWLKYLLGLFSSSILAHCPCFFHWYLQNESSVAPTMIFAKCQVIWNYCETLNSVPRENKMIDRPTDWLFRFHIHFSADSFPNWSVNLFTRGILSISITFVHINPMLPQFLHKWLQWALIKWCAITKFRTKCAKFRWPNAMNNPRILVRWHHTNIVIISAHPFHAARNWPCLCKY